MDALKLENSMQSSSTLIAIGREVLLMLEAADAAQALERIQISALTTLERAERLHTLADDIAGNHT